jgi:hypothetical protein
VNCEVCGTELPHGALFCGECGRAVGVRLAKTVHPDSGMPVDAAPAAAPTRSKGAVKVDHRDTAIIEPVVLGQLPELETELAVSSPEDAPAASAPVASAPAASAPVVSAPAAKPVRRKASAASTPPESESAAPARPDPFPWGDRGSAIFSDSDELEQTLIVPRRDTGERFVLQFSTGESVTVFGTGLLGRNPMPQPTEYFDQLVSITDPGKSVSKTHLEFGQDAGSFWVSDRFSGNGSAVREPESAPHRLIAGKRYRIVRGTRVDIGEQFFVVS